MHEGWKKNTGNQLWELLGSRISQRQQKTPEKQMSVKILLWQRRGCLYLHMAVGFDNFCWMFSIIKKLERDWPKPQLYCQRWTSKCSLSMDADDYFMVRKNTKTSDILLISRPASRIDANKIDILGSYEICLIMRRYGNKNRFDT